MSRKSSQTLRIVREQGLLQAIVYKLEKKGLIAAYKNEGILGLLNILINRNKHWYYSLSNPQWRENLWVKPFWTQFYKLPQNYSYINLGSHGVGYAAWLEMCRICNLAPMDLSVYHRIDFARYYREVSKQQQGKVFGITLDKSYQDSLRIKILSKLHKKVPVFCLVRDPISVIKSHANAFFLPYLRYGGGGTTDVLPYSALEIERIKERCVTDCFLFLLKLHSSWTKTRSHFCYTSSVEQVRNATQEVYYIDMQEIMTSQSSHCVFQKICEILQVPPPQDASAFDISFSKESFLYYGFPYWHTFQELDIPIIYVCGKGVQDFLEIGRVRIVDSRARKDLLCDSESSQTTRDYIMKFGIAKRYQSRLQNILSNQELIQKIHNTAQEYHNCLQVRERLCDTHKVNEKYILVFLRQNTTWMQKLYQVLQYEVSGVKLMRPDIVATWKWYLEFEILYKQMETLSVQERQ
ncbi:DUF2972 domain-containing protein [Helicobacter aurati]|nr:DUF2972 domain-containing protein [Helicobacter aurati]